ncbi:phospholipase A and acyltransferase 2-like [Ptychodera flava]|uniref:phospholipase A and acyltransferase 2-like n=1 Tax=Ptychodera flava TaxID=63121 RepID=UPI00396A0914
MGSWGTVDTINPSLGDRIEIRYQDVNHWGIYAGKDRKGRHLIIHFTPDHDRKTMKIIMGQTSAKVKKELLSDVVGGDLVRVNNSDDSRHRPLAPAEILKKAEAAVGQSLPYKPLENNCEHFTNRCRYGHSKGWSHQVDEFRGGQPTKAASGTATASLF